MKRAAVASRFQRASFVAVTERLALRRFVAEDADAMEAVFCDPEVMRFSDGVLSAARVRTWISAMIDHYPIWGFGMWAVVEKATARTIGYCGLCRHPGRCESNEAELGYRLARAAWHRGYGTEAAATAVHHGLHVLRLAQIVAIVDPRNCASVRVAQKIGMHYERDVVLEGYAHPDHRYVVSGLPARGSPGDRP